MKLIDVLLENVDLSSAVPEDTSYKEFAKAVAKMLREDYGEHNFGPFMEVLHAELGMNEGFFGTSYEKEQRKLEDALDRFVKYSIEKNGDFEDEVESTLEKKARDAVSIYMGGKIDSDKLDKMYTDVMSKVPDYVMQRGEDEVKKMKKNG